MNELLAAIGGLFVLWYGIKIVQGYFAAKELEAWRAEQRLRESFHKNSSDETLVEQNDNEYWS